MTTLRIMDADGHVMEPKGMWEEWIEPAYKARAPRVVKGARIDVDGYLVPRPDGGNQVSAGMQASFRTKVNQFLAKYHQAGYSAEAHLRSMDEAGIEVSFVYPTQGLYAASIDDLDPAFAIAICRAYNNWITEYCKLNSSRLRPVAMLTALHDPVFAVAEATRVAGMGMRAVFVRPNPVRGRNLDDPAYEPLWAECERLGLTVGVHEGVGARLPAAGAERYPHFFGSHSSCHPIEQMLAMLALITGGVLERYPRLRVGFLESGCGWLPYWLWRLDEHREKTLGVPSEPQLPLRPSDYFRRQCWISCEPDEPYISQILDFIGEDRLLFASDYPHPDHKWPETVENTRALSISDRAKRKLLWDNPSAFYGLS